MFLARKDLVTTSYNMDHNVISNPDYMMPVILFSFFGNYTCYGRRKCQLSYSSLACLYMMLGMFCKPFFFFFFKGNRLNFINEKKLAQKENYIFTSGEI